MKPRVIYHTNIPSPYMVDRFNRIAERGNIDFEALFHDCRYPDRSWDVREDDWLFRFRYMGAGRFGHLLGPARHILNARPAVVSLYESARYGVGLAAAKCVRAKTVIHVLKVFDTWRPKRRSREAAKRLLFPRAGGIHSPGRDAVSYARSYGGRESQFHVFPEPIDVDHFVEGSGRSAATKAEAGRLGLSGCVSVVVGRVIRHKGFDCLLDAYERLQEEGQNFVRDELDSTPLLMQETRWREFWDEICA